MSCKCKTPKRIKNSAGGVEFFVCSKSQGGCGEEIQDKKEAEDYGDPGDCDIWKDCQYCGGVGSIPKYYVSSGYCEINCDHCGGSGRV